MFARHVVVDGSNIATEGRSMPSLAQLDEAVRAYRREFPDDIIVVVVDATFGHRIDESERATFDEAVAHNEIVSPPAGAIGRGDAFLLRIAEKVGATVLSNDSFQEFHGEYEWLFTNGRLIGGKPVPGVGWIFTPRTPVRGPRSRDAVRTAKRERGARRARPEEQKQKVEKAIAVATEEVVEPDSPAVKRRRRRRGSSPPAEPVNEPLAFIELVAKYPLGSEIEGEVETFSSHGAFIRAGGARCYIPLAALGDPPPRAAKDVLRKGEVRTFVVQALDPPRRGVELALPEFARISGSPSPETVEEEIRTGEVAASPAAGGEPPSRRRRGGPRRRGEQVEDAIAVPAESPEPFPAEEPSAEPVPAALLVDPETVMVPRPQEPAPATEPEVGAPVRAPRKRAAAKLAAAPAAVVEEPAKKRSRAAKKAAATALSDPPAPAAAAAQAPVTVADTDVETPAPRRAPAPARSPRKRAAVTPPAVPTAEAAPAPEPPAPMPARARVPRKSTAKAPPPGSAAVQQADEAPAGERAAPRSRKKAAAAQEPAETSGASAASAPAKKKKAPATTKKAAAKRAPAAAEKSVTKAKKAAAAKKAPGPE